MAKTNVGEVTIAGGKVVSVSSNFSLAPLGFFECTKLLLFDHDDQQSFFESCDLQKN